jgi:adenylate cyclase
MPIMSTPSRIFLLLILGNLGGALLTFVHLRFLDLFALEGVAPLGWLEALFFLIAFTALIALGRLVARRWTISVVRVTAALPDDPGHATLRRRAVQLPGFLALLSLAGWIMAAIVWSFVWPLVMGRFDLPSALRQGFGMALIAGPTVALFVFLASERIWRERLPVLFPHGDLAATGAHNWRVRTRMLAVFLFTSIVPLLVMSVATSVRVQSMRAASHDQVISILQNLMLMQGALMVTGVVLARYLADSVSAPLRELQSAMEQVAQGDLLAHCPVVSNDEIGAVTAGFNHMVTGLRERESIRETFGRYVSLQIRDEILSGRVGLAGDQRDVTILFADLRGFTTWAEASPAAEVVEGRSAEVEVHRLA